MYDNFINNEKINDTLIPIRDDKLLLAFLYVFFNLQGERKRKKFNRLRYIQNPQVDEENIEQTRHIALKKTQLV